MKRVGYLYNKMLNKELIRQVIEDSAKGKHKRHDVQKALENINKTIDKVYDLVLNDSYVPTKPHNVTIHDKSSNKQRVIGVVPFYPDGIMHRLVTEVMKPVLMRGMYAHSCASIPNRGNAHASRYLKKALKHRTNSKYCAKLDIKQYYPSLKPENVIKALSRKIKDKKFLDLVYRIISSNSENQEGMTIGFYINQWLANFYLESLDHTIISMDGVVSYVRNMDDMILLGRNKKKLHRAVDTIRWMLRDMGLQLKENWQVFKVDSRGIDFVGYVFHHGYTTLRKRNFLKLTRQSRRLYKYKRNHKNISFHQAAGLVSRTGQLVHCDGANIKNAYLDKGVRIRTLKKIIRRHNKYLRDQHLKKWVMFKIKLYNLSYNLSEKQLSEIADELVKRINNNSKKIKKFKKSKRYKELRWRKFLVRKKKKKAKW